MDRTKNEFGWRKLPAGVMREIAGRARNLRKHKKLSQKQLALRSGVSLGSLKRFENTGQISLESLLKLAFALEVLDTFNSAFQFEITPSSLDDLLK